MDADQYWKSLPIEDRLPEEEIEYIDALVQSHVISSLEAVTLKEVRETEGR